MLKYKFIGAVGNGSAGRCMIILATRWRSCLRHCATSRKVTGSIPASVIVIFHWHNPSGRTMALGLTQPLTEMSTKNITGGKGGRYVGLTTLPPSCADCLEIWDSQPPGTFRACPGLQWDWKIPVKPSGIEPATFRICSAVPQPTAPPRAPVVYKRF